MFGDDLWIVSAVAIPWHLDFHRTEITLNLFQAFAVAVVTTAASFRGVLFVTEMMVPSVITSKPATRDHQKSGQWDSRQTQAVSTSTNALYTLLFQSLPSPVSKV